MRCYGCHVSAAGGLENAIKNGRDLGVNSIQIHPSPPQRWNLAPYPDGYEDRFIRERGDSGILHVFFHAIYLINLATPDLRKLKLGKLSLSHDLDLITRIGGDGVIVHVGSMKDQKDEDAGYRQVISAINAILDDTPNGGQLLLEVAAGSGKIIGADIAELARIYNGVEKKDRVGFALDSQHMWASGYDWQNNLDAIVDQVSVVLGLEKIGAIHLNDSKTECGSRRDRHENLGDGRIGAETLSQLITHPKLHHIPFILETPALKSITTAKGEVKKLRQWIGG